MVVAALILLFASRFFQARDLFEARDLFVHRQSLNKSTQPVLLEAISRQDVLCSKGMLRIPEQEPNNRPEPHGPSRQEG